MLEKALPETRHRSAYQAVDGSHTIKGVMATAGMGQQAVYELLERCTSMGLMERDEKGKACRLFDLKDFGLLVGQPGTDCQPRSNVKDGGQIA